MNPPSDASAPSGKAVRPPGETPTVIGAPRTSAAPAETIVPGPNAATQVRNVPVTADPGAMPTQVSPRTADPDATRLNDASSPTPSPRAPDKRIGPYDILEELGAGGMGIVYLARQRMLNRTVALKVIKGYEQADQGRIQRFLREAQAAARLTHPGIVPVHEVGVDGDVYYYSMEYVLGQSLEDLARAEKLTPRRSLEFVRQIARALSYAHAEGVIHRDIKPANIMITGDGRALITDFGLAKDRTHESLLTQEGAALGTPTYMSPEQALGRLQELDGRTDVYSMGGVLYFLLTGQPPFLGETPFEVVRKLLTDLPVPVRQVAPAVNADIETICLKCLEKERERRYASAGALADDLDRFLEGLPISARPVSLVGKLVRTGRRHLGMSLGAAALVLAVCGATLYGRWQDLKREDRAAQDRLRLGLSTRVHQEALRTLQSAMAHPGADFPAVLSTVRAALDGVLAEQPGYREARQSRAEVEILALDFQAAALDLDAVLKESPDDEAALYAFQRLSDIACDAQLDISLPSVIRGAESAIQRLRTHGNSDLTARSRLRVLLHTGPWEEAVRVAEELVRMPAGSGDQGDLAGLCLAAHWQARDLEYSEFLARCDAALRLRPVDLAASRVRTVVLGALDRKDEAIEEKKRCLSLQPRPLQQDLETLCYIYKTHYDGEDNPEYGKALAQITHDYPEMPVGWLWLGRYHRDAGRFAESAAALNQAARVTPNPFPVVAEMYLTRYAAKGAAEACASLETALREHPPADAVAQRGGAAVNDLIDALIKTKEFTRAAAILESCRARLPGDAELLEQTADVYFSMDHDAEALQFYEAAIQANPTTARLHARRSRLLRIKRRYPEAIEEMEKAVALSPDNTVNRTQLGFLYFLSGRPQEAAEQFAVVLVLTPTLELEEKLHRWAAGDFTQGEPVRAPKSTPGVDPEKMIASSLIQRALPGVAKVLLRRGMQALASGDYAAAERSFTTACIGIPKSPDPYVCLARLHAKRESWLTAIVCLERAADLGYAKFSAIPDDSFLKGLQLFPRVRNLIEAEAEKKK